MFEIKRLDLNNKQKHEFLELMSTSLSIHNMDWLEWKYINNPIIDDKPTVFGAFHKTSGKLVGVRPFLACNIVLNNKVFKAAQPGDTVVHPKFRGIGLFTEMNRVAIEELGEDGYDIFFNFPNRNSQPGNLKMGWRQILVFDESLAFNNFSRVIKDTTGNSLYELGGKILSIGMPGLNKIINNINKKIDLEENDNKIQIEKKFDDSVENLWLIKEKNRFRVRRDKEYLNWRFKDRPDKDYKYWTIRENQRLYAYMITTFSDRWGSKEGQIVDFNFIDEIYFFALLQMVLRDFNNSKCNFVSILSCTEANIFKELNKIGFIHRFQFPYSLAMPNRNFLVRAVNPELLQYDLYSDVKWNIRSGDQDTY